MAPSLLLSALLVLIITHARAAWRPTVTTSRVTAYAVSRRCRHSPCAQEWAAPAEPDSPWSSGGAEGQSSTWGDDDFGAEWGDTLDEAPASTAPEDEGAWGDGSWGDAGVAGSWDGDEADGSPAADWLSPSPTKEPAPVRREIECTNVGIVSTPFKRRNGIYAEVTIQHKESADTVTTLWFANEVLQDVAALRQRDWLELGHEAFAEEVVRYLRDSQGVDFSDPDWGMATDLPFTTQFIIVRKLFSLYPDFPEQLASALLPDEPPPYSLKDLHAYADGSVRYTPSSFWEEDPTPAPLAPSEAAVNAVELEASGETGETHVGGAVGGVPLGAVEAVVE